LSITGPFEGWSDAGDDSRCAEQVAARRRSGNSDTRPGDIEAQKFARDMGAARAGSSSDSPPGELDAAIIFAPDGALVPTALRVVVKGGAVACGGEVADPRRCPPTTMKSSQ
jgi:hypothetical protein